MEPQRLAIWQFLRFVNRTIIKVSIEENVSEEYFGWYVIFAAAINAFRVVGL